MATPVSDVTQLVTAALVNTSGVSALVGGRVFSGHSRDADAQTAEYPRVVVLVRGGRRLYASRVGDVVFELYAYSRTSQGEASALYELCREALHGERLVQEGITPATVPEETLGLHSGYDAVGQAWYAWGRFKAPIQAA